MLVSDRLPRIHNVMSDDLKQIRVHTAFSFKSRDVWEGLRRWEGKKEQLFLYLGC